MAFEFRSAQCKTAHFKCIIKSDVVKLFYLEKIKKKNAFSCKFKKNIKRAVV